VKRNIKALAIFHNFIKINKQEIPEKINSMPYIYIYICVCVCVCVCVCKLANRLCGVKFFLETDFLNQTHSSKIGLHLSILERQAIPKLQFKNHMIRNRSQPLPFVSTVDLKSLVK